jgi:selenocysteine-specific elongation factor
MVEDVRKLLTDKGEATIAEIRDHLDTTRKYVLALMEYLDAEGITRREGDVRRLIDKNN